MTAGLFGLTNSNQVFQQLFLDVKKHVFISIDGFFKLEYRH
jgi:hypothetical protein